MSEAERAPGQSPDGEPSAGRMSWLAEAVQHCYDPGHPVKPAWLSTSCGTAIGLIGELDGRHRPLWLVMYVFLLTWSVIGVLVRPPRSVRMTVAMWSALAAALVVPLTGEIVATILFR